MHLSEDEIKEVFFKALNQLSKDKNDTICNMKELKEMVCNTIVLEEELRVEIIEKEALDSQIQNLITENATTALDQGEYALRYNALIESYNNKKSKCDKLAQKIESNNARNNDIDNFINGIKEMDDEYVEFNDYLWFALADFITVYTKDDIRVTFKGGLEIRV